jgi:hypothetical protein
LSKSNATNLLNFFVHVRARILFELIFLIRCPCSYTEKLIITTQKWLAYKITNTCILNLCWENALCLQRNLFHKMHYACSAICFMRRNFFIKNLEIVCLRLSVPLSKIGTRTGASLSSIRKDKN